MPYSFLENGDRDCSHVVVIYPAIVEMRKNSASGVFFLPAHRADSILRTLSLVWTVYLVIPSCTGHPKPHLLSFYLSSHLSSCSTSARRIIGWTRNAPIDALSLLDSYGSMLRGKRTTTTTPLLLRWSLRKAGPSSRQITRRDGTGEDALPVCRLSSHPIRAN